ncbi:MAG: septum formation protein Maf [Nitrospirae bacterium GWC2_57_13]|jgi:septum formation protein|nr:MAG: septum formation protein Maf [Nitrospirae bacterium GWC1_57_7]OGW28662.1 MAG: septum formation protein Maf [Nitrospirae bacterium GWC2_57_13]OGW44021.1 MAG: septum formation protein Maf [Nitrospirae bacterium GWD2_57_8]HAR46790.1 septum formation inhibitor Maf [Nitrospiraceae bacterium]HAS53970.1 septum formation inhibitor Maf [Nitrospiraceae bacterium]
MRPKIILASNSPRRKELLRQIGLSFTAAPADVDERVLAEETPEVYACRLARQKAEAAGLRTEEGIIIAADTIVVLEGSILGKPDDAQDAKRMLSMLSGKMHRVITALAVLDKSAEEMAEAAAVTKVWFRELAESEIASYVRTGEPLDKAGAYGIQERGALLVDRIEGCYFNVVGLPLSLLAGLLRRFGIELM